jgi:hypothetical protein
MSAQTLGFAVRAEDRPALDELVEYFGDGNRSAYLRATLRIMKSIMIADQLRQSGAYASSALQNSTSIRRRFRHVYGSS